jgi:hypothetical protein
LSIQQRKASGKSRKTTEKDRDQPPEGEESVDHILEHHKNHCYNYLITPTLERIQPDFAVIGFLAS